MKTILEKLAAFKDPQVLEGRKERERERESEIDKERRKRKRKKNEGKKPAVMLNVLGRDLPQ